MGDVLMVQHNSIDHTGVPGVSSGSVATDTIWDAAGDLAVGTGANTAARMARGSTGQGLVATSTSVAFVDILPWHVVILPTIWTPDATTGTWALSSAAESAGDYGFYKPGSAANSGGAQSWANAGSNAQNDACAWDVILAAGTWEAHFFVRKSTNTAIITLNQDGASAGTVDTYAAAAAAGKVSITGWTVSTTGKHRMEVKAATRNASNSTGWVLNFTAIELHRTA